MKVKIRSHKVDLEVLDRPQPPSDSSCSIVKLTKTSALNLRQLPLANGTTFSKISKTEINLESYSQIFERIFPEVFFPFHFAPGIARIFG